MATGIEAAGIVLAVLPLFISALEHYSEGLDPMRAFFEFDSQWPVQIRKLRDQHINYNLTLKLLLSSIAEPDEVEEMIADPGGSRWKDNSMQRRLEERLDESYSAYLDTIKRIEEIMKEIAKDLKVDQSERTTRTDLQALLKRNPRKDNQFEFGRRVKFGMRVKKLKALLDDLDSENRKLERFTDKTERLEPYRAAKPTSVFDPPLDDIRSYAKYLYAVLCVDASCQLSSHQAKLQLEKRLRAKRRRSFAKQQDEDKPAVGPSFRLSIYNSRWQNVEVEILQSSRDSQRTRLDDSPLNQPLPISIFTKPAYTRAPKLSEVVDTSIVSNNNGSILVEKSHSSAARASQTPGMKQALGKAFKGSKGKIIDFVSASQSLSPPIKQAHTGGQSSTISGKSGSTNKPKTSKTVAWATPGVSAIPLHTISSIDSTSISPQEVVDICTVIRKSKTRNACHGLCLDYNGQLRRSHSIEYSKIQKDVESTEETPMEDMTLDRLLSSVPNQYGCALSRKDRMTLALTLASSFAQLDATPWIPDSWGKEDIVFYQPMNLDASKINHVDVSKPSILRLVDKTVRKPAVKSIQTSENYSLLSLGILLLELSTGQSFEQHQSRNKGKQIARAEPPQESVERLMKLSEASKWLNAVQDDLSDGFLLAIRHCIRSYFDGSSGDNEAVFRQALLDQVVMPLQEDLHSFLGTRAL